MLKPFEEILKKPTFCYPFHDKSFKYDIKKDKFLLSILSRNKRFLCHEVMVALKKYILMNALVGMS